MTNRFCTLCRQTFTTMNEFWTHPCYEGDSENWEEWIKEKEKE
ncbi:MAG: hypothetical protein ACXAC2_00345 [Candidatus Kariarchaeaceae archaeon]|jgi:hypothetical protein